jgi:hypothetical protein
MGLLWELAQAQASGICIDLGRLSDMSALVNQRRQCLEEDLEVQLSVRQELASLRGLSQQQQQQQPASTQMSCHSDMVCVKPCESAQRSQDAGTPAGVSIWQVHAAIASIQRQLSLLLRFSRTRSHLLSCAQDRFVCARLRACVVTCATAC